jgi:hypothetical protein
MNLFQNMNKRKVLIPELFGEVVQSNLQTHPRDNSVFAISGDDQLTVVRFDVSKNGKASKE